MKKIVFMLLFSFSLFADDALIVNNTDEVLIIKNTKVSYDQKMDLIRIEWENLGYPSYSVLRSDKIDSGFTQIALIENSVQYEDSKIGKGIKYWYKVIPVSDESVSDDGESVSKADEKLISEEKYLSLQQPAVTEKTGTKTPATTTEESNIGKDAAPEYIYSAYSPKPVPKGLPLDKLIKEKTQTIKIPKEAEQKNSLNRRLEYLSQYYMHSIKLSLAMSFSKQYINSGELNIFDKFANYELNEREKKIIFFGESYDYAVEFESNKLFRILNGSKDEELKELLLKNAETFCLYSGEKVYVDKDGITRYIHTFDAVGLSTRYLKNDKDWKKKTIMVSTSRKDLQQKLQNAQRR
ncbi:MAG: hypothetical protein KA015_01365 [Spirochaetes bacterium]|nr:hypothetical protein [Spirochaetota bacterium]